MVDGDDGWRWLSYADDTTVLTTENAFDTNLNGLSNTTSTNFAANKILKTAGLLNKIETNCLKVF